MGFTHEQALDALHKCKNDVEQAISYLLGEGLVEINNKSEIPDLVSLTGSVPKEIEYLPPVAPPAPTVSTQTAESTTSQNRPVPPPPPSRELQNHSMTVASDSDNDDTSESDDDMIVYANESNSDLPKRLPEVQPRVPEIPAAILSPNTTASSNLASAMIASLLQIDEFKTILQSLNSDSIKKLNELLQTINGEDNYVVNDLEIPGDDGGYAGIEDYVPMVCETLVKEFELANLDNQKLRDFFTSSVGEGDDSQDLFAIEIDSDTRDSDFTKTLNELIWGKNFENFGTLAFDRIGSVLSFCYVGDDLTYRLIPTHLADRIYPHIYSREVLPELVEMNNKFDHLNESKIKLTTNLMNLLLFQGKKIKPFLSQTVDFIDDEKVKGKLSGLSEKLDQERVKINDEISEVLRNVRDYDVRDSKNLKHELQPYKLIFVGFSEFEYFYYQKSADNWVYVNIQSDYNFSQDIVEFDLVKQVVLQRTNSRIIPLLLLYCDETKITINDETPDLIDLDSKDSDSEIPLKSEESKTSAQSSKATLVDED